jgi:hypothetical protein
MAINNGASLRGELEGRMMACSSGVVRSVMPSRSGFINESDSL